MSARALYGYCPVAGCTSKGVQRERRFNGNDTCNKGHVYASSSARKSPQRKKRPAILNQKRKTLVNNIIFVIDQSWSMNQHRAAVDKVVRDLSSSLGNSNIKTRVSVYVFNDYITQKFFLTEDLSALKNFALSPAGNTALIDATYRAVVDHRDRSYSSNEDNTFLMYVITDGENNVNRGVSADHLKSLILNLDDSWTVASMVPNLRAVSNAKNCGIPAGNIEVWDTTSNTGFEEAGIRINQTYDTYTTSRLAGLRSTKNLFEVNAAHITKSDVKANLGQENARLFRVYQEEPIRDFVTRNVGSYKIGHAFYELVKREKLQPQKEIAIVSQDGKSKYFGDNARQMLGLDIGGHIKVKPGDHGDWRIFVQSTSVNRKCVPGQSILVRE